MRKGASKKGFKGKLQDIEVVVSDPPRPAWIAPDSLTSFPGLRVTQTAEPQHWDQSEDFEHSGDYRSVRLRGKIFALTPAQASIIENLHDAWERRVPYLGLDYLMERAGSSHRMADVFRSNMKAYKALIKSGVRRGTYRLNL